MATYEVKHEDGRVTKVHSDSSEESTIRRQANHQETTRAVIADRLGRPRGAEPSIAVSVTKVSD